MALGMALLRKAAAALPDPVACAHGRETGSGVVGWLQWSSMTMDRCAQGTAPHAVAMIVFEPGYWPMGHKPLPTATAYSQ
jgi:hypothetical protein